MIQLATPRTLRRHGIGASGLGLEGVVAAADLRAIVRAVDPVSGAQLLFDRDELDEWLEEYAHGPMP